MTGRSLTQLREQIAEELDRLLFDEVAKSLEAGAMRAAYVMTWIAVAESLRNKFLVMADRDAEVERLVGDLEREEANDRPTDRFLLDHAARLGLVSSDEQKKLEHIRQMRNVYGHPRQAGPTHEETISALSTAVDAVLSRTPMLRHGYVNGLLVSLFDERHFLDDVEVVVSEYAAGVAHRVHPDVWPHLLKGLVERLEPAMQDPELDIYRRRGLRFGRAFLAELAPDLSEERWDLVGMMRSFPRSVSAILADTKVWSLVPAQATDMMIGHLIEPEDRSSPRPIDLRLVLRLRDRKLLTDRQRERFQGVLATVRVNLLVAADIPLAEYAPRLVEELASHNWYRQNPACDALMDVGPEAAQALDEMLLEQLGRNVLQAAEGASGSARLFMEKEEERAGLWPKRFVLGLFGETLVNDQDEFRLKGAILDEAARFVAAHPDRSDILTTVREAVLRSSPKWAGVLSDDYEQAASRLKTMDLKSRLEGVINAIEKAHLAASEDSCGSED